MTPNAEAPQILHQEVALDSYLRNLLEAIPETPGVPPVVQKEPQKVRHLRPVPTIEPVASPVLELAPKPVKPLALMPAWTREPFQVLLFRLDRLILAAPLLQLANTARYAEITTKLPKQPSWLIGLQRVQQRNLAIIDSQQIFLGKQAKRRDLARQGYGHLLVSEQQRWALACDELLSVVTLTPEQVRWRTQRLRRPWLLGSVIEDLTILIDMTQIFPKKNQGF